MTLQLYPYQQKDLDFFKNWGRSANWSEPGVGKTPVAVRLIEQYQAFPALIICPSSVKFHWESEIKKFWSGKLPTIYQYHEDSIRHGTVKKFDILIVNYELFRQDFKEFFADRQFGMTVFDEAHRLKNLKSNHRPKRKGKKFVAQTAVCASELKTEYMHLITGTPITNEFDEAYSYLRLLFPDQFKNYWRFVNHYGFVDHNGFGKEITGLNPKKAQELARLMQQFSIRHTKKEVLPQLPEKQYQTIEVELTPQQRKAYDELETFMITELEQNVVEVPNIISLMTKLRQIALSTELVNPSGIVYSAKQKALLEILQDRILAGKQTVVMSEFRKWIDILEQTFEAKGIATVRITGSENDEQRQDAMKRFQNGEVPVILCTIKAAGLGIDLTAADMVIFTDISWTDTDNQQAEDRIHRASQTKGVQVVKLFAKGTMDAVILDRTQLKALTAGQVLGDEFKNWVESPAQKEEIIGQT